MVKKLTLTVEQDIIELAKIYAQNKGRSLSDLVENYLRTLVKHNQSEDDLCPEVKNLLGSVKVPEHFDYKKELSEAIRKDHLL